MPFTFHPTEFRGLTVVEPKVFPDSRGYFLETFKNSDFAANGITEAFSQDNQALSSRGALRGLHFQKEPYAQAKIVRVIQGAVFDVAVDIRKESDTFLRHFTITLSGENKKMLYVPVGFAHGYLSLENNTIFVYKCSGMYSPEHEAGIRWDDPGLGISWPVEDPVVSEKDRKLPFSADFFRINSK